MSWFERTELLLGKEKQEKLKTAKILVCGLGGVGGATVEQLVRAGASDVTIIDADAISETNINRQIIATYNNIGKNKTDEFYLRLKSINPEANIHIRNIFLKDELLQKTLDENWDFVIDAIDTLSPKLNLIRICYEKKIPFVSSMGAGGKTDPLSIRIDDISKSFNCGLAKMLRKRLHKIGIYDGIEVVYSIQKTDKDSIIEEETQNKKSNVGTISYMPVVFGCMCAYAAIRRIVDLK
ncbi:MAG: tRNA threonylcarbamoyladenosine dehydratase [Bacteroidales bacterium]|jgi:tRNA A37 threonylcarbamoyladenosine dehydratase|nr:tRNA threonylcarbamoyladenosine dehydratase [Bacteroidales bacterium]